MTELEEPFIRWFICGATGGDKVEFFDEVLAFLAAGLLVFVDKSVTFTMESSSGPSVSSISFRSLLLAAFVLGTATAGLTGRELWLLWWF